MLLKICREKKKFIIFYTLPLGIIFSSVADIHTHTDVQSLGQIKKKAIDQLSVLFETASIFLSIAIAVFPLERTTLGQAHFVNPLGKFTEWDGFEDKPIILYIFVALSQAHLVIRMHFFNSISIIRFGIKQIQPVKIGKNISFPAFWFTSV